MDFHSPEFDFSAMLCFNSSTLPSCETATAVMFSECWANVVDHKHG